ncbi:hypothetical protein KF707_19520 [Candidatus Obscuribacterales bacterium]|nr:hypothetical protein [Candidatus Obscuribacterales bacterium]
MKKYVARIARGLAVLGNLSALALGSSASAQEQFPVRMQGFWVLNEKSCALLRVHGPSILLAGQYKDQWIKISGPDVIGTSNGKLLRIISSERVEALLDAEFVEGKKLVHEYVLLRDGRLTEGVHGARAVQYFNKCQ